jgi:hypothetical protein
MPFSSEVKKLKAIPFMTIKHGQKQPVVGSGVFIWDAAAKTGVYEPDDKNNKGKMSGWWILCDDPIPEPVVQPKKVEAKRDYISTLKEGRTITVDDVGCLLEVDSFDDAIIIVGAGDFKAGDCIEVFRLGQGEVRIVSESGVDLRSADDRSYLHSRHSVASIVCRGKDRWILSGDLK